MSKPVTEDLTQEQLDLVFYDGERSLLDRMLSDSRLYRSSQEFRDLLDFTIRLRTMAPFNAMLLQIQKPDLKYAASEYDWRVKFQRRIKDKSRPLFIMWPFGPVALVYDLLDTEGPDLPKDALAYFAKGRIDGARIGRFKELLTRKMNHTTS